MVGSERHLFCNRVHIDHSRSSKVVDFGTNQKGVCADELNNYYAQIPTDPDYDKESVTCQLSDVWCNQKKDFCDWSASSVCVLLSKMKQLSWL